MLFDVIENYDEKKIDYLKNLWEKIIEKLVLEEDKKKILSFLNKAGIIEIDEKSKKIYVWLSNEFFVAQVKKLFQKPLNKIVKQIYNPNFSVAFVVYEKFQSGRHPLQLNLTKFLWNKEKKESKKTVTSTKSSKSKLENFSANEFDHHYRFDTFVVGRNNQLAFSASKAVAENPGKVHNPLFIYGWVGLGKTHLLQAIGNYIKWEDKSKAILYMQTTNLIDDIVEAIRKNKVTSLVKQFKDIDIIMFDDIQFLADKERTQEIFHNIFNDFYSAKKQIVLTSDRPPKELVTLEARLRSRFSLGLVVDIKQPDLETRIAILQKKLIEKWEEPIENKFLEIIAKTITNNVRELEWALNLLITRRKMFNELTEADIYDTLETLGYKKSKTHEITPEVAYRQNTKSTKNFSEIVEYVANYYDIPVSDIKWKSRKKEVSIARQMLMTIWKKYFNWTLEKIWDYFWGKNHASVLYSINTFERLVKNDKKIYNDYMVILDETMLK
jgi:chromosomal replication initiator protein